MDIEDMLARGDFLAIDVEGDGGRPHQAPLEIALIRYEGGVVVSSKVFLVNPGRPIDPFVTGLHGLADADVAHLPPFAAIEEDVRREIEGSFLVGHVLVSDLQMLEETMPYVRSLPAAMMDTQRLARAVLQSEKSNLGTVSEMLGLGGMELPGRGGAHTAERDARLAGEILLKLVPMIPTKAKHRKSIIERTTMRPTMPVPTPELSSPCTTVDRKTLASRSESVATSASSSR